MPDTVIKLDFADEGQDFTSWYIHAGRVVDCEPFQRRVWVNTTLLRKPKTGENPRILTPRGRYITLKYTVAKLTTLDAAQSAEVMAHYRDLMREMLAE